MSYQIVNARFYKLESDKKYFLDANIWIFVIAQPNNIPNKIKKYLELFEKILEDSSIKIVVPALLISEVVNRILKSVYYPEFLRKKGIDKNTVGSDYYKTFFRPSQDYVDALSTLTDDFLAYKDHVEFISDGFGDIISQDDILTNISNTLDFNDNYYYHLCQKRNYILVTDDSDYWVEDTKIVTLNNKLIENQNSVNISNQKSKRD